MNEIDNRIVGLGFDNQKFESGVKTSIGTIDKLKNSLDFKTSEANLDSLYQKGHLFNLDNMATAVDSLANRFSTLGIVGMTVISNLTTMAMKMAGKLADFFITPIVEGGEKRAENIEQAKFQFKGLGMDIEKTMASALAAVKGTAYGLDEAAMVASQLGASGMRAGDKMTKSLRAVAGVAAMTGSSYSDIGQIFTTVAGNGRMMGEQLRQLSYKGLNAAAIIGKYLGKSEAAVREMTTDGKISFEIFSAAMDDAFGKHAKDANKLFSGALANMRAALARIGAEVQSVKLNNFRDILNALIPIIDTVHIALMPLINAFNAFQTAMAKMAVLKLNNFEKFVTDYAFLSKIVSGTGNIFTAFHQVLKAIGKAFKEVFPPATEKQLMSFVTGFEALTSKLKISKETSERITSIFKGLFSSLRLGVTIVIKLAQCIFGLAQSLAPVGGLILDIAGAFGKFLTKANEAIQSADIFGKVIDFCSSAGKAVAYVLSNLGRTLPFFANVAKGVGEVFKALFSGITDGINGINVDKLMDILNKSLIGVVLLNLATMIAKISFMLRKGGPFSGIIAMFDPLKTVLYQMQGMLKAEVLMKLAKAILMMAIAMVLMASIKPERLSATVTAMGVMFSELLGGLALLMKMPGGDMGIKQMFVLTQMLSTLAGTIFILAIAMKIISTIDWPGIAKGILSVAALAGILLGASKLMEKSSPMLIKAGAEFSIFAIAINLLAIAMKKIGDLKIEVIEKGLLGIIVMMEMLVIFCNKLDTTLTPKIAFSILLLSVALNALSFALATIGNLNMKQIGKGLLGIGSMLAMIVIFSKLMGKVTNIIVVAQGMLILSAAMTVFSLAIKNMGSMSMEEISRGLLVFGGALLLLALGMKDMEASAAGAAAFILVAIAMTILTVALKTFASFSLGEIFKSLGMLAGVFILLAAAGLLLGPLIPELLGLGAAIALIGTGVALTGVGLVAIAAGITALAAAGAAGTIAVVGFLTAAINLMPKFFEGLGIGFVSFMGVLAKSGASITAFLTTMLQSLLTALGTVIPQTVATVMKLLYVLLENLVNFIPYLVDAGFKMLLGILQGISDNIEQVVEVAVTIVANFINGIADSLPTIIQAGWNLLLAFINGIANSVRDNNPKLIKAVDNLLDAFVTAAKEWLVAGITGIEKVGKDIVQGIINGVEAKIADLGSAAKKLGAALLAGICKFLGIKSPSTKMIAVGKHSVMGLVKGLNKFGGLAATAAKNVGKKALNSLGNAVSNIAGMISGDIDLSPSIRPVIDMSDVEANSKRIGSLIGGTKSISVNASIKKAASISESASKTTTNTPIGAATVAEGTYSFVQNNYSPKALSRLEIYRQTNNQFSALKGMVNI